LREIPVLGTAVNLAKVVASIPDRVFVAKVRRFLFTIDEIPKEKMRNFCNQLSEDPELSRKAGEIVILALESADDLKKAAIIGKLFSYFIEGEIDFSTLRRMLLAVSGIY